MLFLACLFGRHHEIAIVVVFVVVVIVCSQLLKKYLRYQHQTWIMTRCNYKTRGITLKAIILELCRFLLEILSRMMAFVTFHVLINMR